MFTNITWFPVEAMFAKYHMTECRHWPKGVIYSSMCFINVC